MDRVKHFLKSIEDWKYDKKRKGSWLKKAPDAMAYDLSEVSIGLESYSVGLVLDGTELCCLFILCMATVACM